MKKQQSGRCKPKKDWKPDTERMAEYNRRIFELLWDEEEQKTQNIKEHYGSTKEKTT